MISNLGPGVAHNVNSTEAINITGGNLAGVSDFETNRGEWTHTEFPGVTPSAEFAAQISELAPQETATFTFIARIRGPQATIVSTANVSSDTPDPNLANSEGPQLDTRSPIVPRL